MCRFKGLLAVAAMGLFAIPLAGQERAVVFHVMGGGYNHLANLNETGPDAHFKMGYTLGTAIGVDVNDYVGLRFDASLARTKGRGDVPFVDEIVNRYLLGGHVEFRYPFRQVQPFVYGGTGVIFVDQQGREITEDFEHFNRVAGIFGAGLRFDIPNSPVDIITEGRATTFKWVADPFSRVQWDVGYTLGFAYRWGF